MNDPKTPLNSVTIVSGAVLAINSVLAIFGHAIDPTFADEAIKLIQVLVTLVGAIGVVYGRIRAKTAIS